MGPHFSNGDPTIHKLPPEKIGRNPFTLYTQFSRIANSTLLFPVTRRSTTFKVEED